MLNAAGPSITPSSKRIMKKSISQLVPLGWHGGARIEAHAILTHPDDWEGTWRNAVGAVSPHLEGALVDYVARISHFEVRLDCSNSGGSYSYCEVESVDPETGFWNRAEPAAQASYGFVSVSADLMSDDDIHWTYANSYAGFSDTITVFGSDQIAHVYPFWNWDLMAAFRVFCVRLSLPTCRFGRPLTLRAATCSTSTHR
jgi:hypothetical protein